MDNLVTAQINNMARRTRTEVTPAHLRILEFAYDYYERHRVGPLYANLKRHTGATRQELERLFPAGLQSVYTWVGIPIHTPGSPCKPLAKIEVEEPREVYLDYNATTYLREEVAQLLCDRYGRAGLFGNPSSSSTLGKHAYNDLRHARERFATCLAVEPDEIVFTGGGSEANNTAIKGVAFAHLARPGHLITSRSEHSAVLESMRFLETLGFDVTYLDVEPDGRVRPESVAEALRENTLLAAIMAVNNEIGVINPVDEIAAICRAAEVPLFVDAIQAFGKIPLAPKRSGITMLSLSGHKIHAPKGVGALYVDRSQSLVPLIHGGQQERGRRAGTENVDAIVAFGLAAELAHAEREREQARLRGLSEDLLAGLRAIEPELVVNGSLEHRVAGNLNVGFPGIDSGSLLLSLNHIGVYASAGSACHAGGVETSHVIAALGLDTERYGTMRFGLGLETTREDLDYLLTYLPRILEMLRRDASARS